jgi:peptidoglycan/xylan/chitin deacetylase (PgdA/CDA1 family)
VLKEDMISKRIAIISAVIMLAVGGALVVHQLLPQTNQNIPSALPPNPIAATSDTTSTQEASAQKRIALTFDDGPYGTSTRQILDILKREGVHATFFVIGKQVEKFPDEVRRELTEGHVVGNHSYDHSMRLPEMTANVFKQNLDEAESIITSSTGFSPTLFRPPYGSLSDTMRQVLKTKGYRTVLWNIDPEDWNYDKSPSQAIIQRVLAAAKPEAIILMHDGRDTHVDYPRDNTINALPTLIETLKARGYTFVTLNEL